MTYHVVPAGAAYRPKAAEVFEMRQGDRTVYATDRTGLVEALIPGYDTLDDTAEGIEDALHARWRQASTIAANLQQATLSAYVSSGEVSLADYSQEQLDAMFPQAAVEVPEPFTGKWDNPAPLILVRTDYDPYTGRPEPTGNVVYIDPSTETAYLDSLAALGLFELVVRAEPTD